MAGERNFNQEAAGWDTPPRVKMAQDIAGALVKSVRLTPEMDVLDFGCGTGLLAFQLAPLVRSVTGVDSAKGMLEVLQAKAQDLGAGNVTTRFLDLASGDQLTGHYHLIISSMTLHHIQDIPALLAQFRQALRPNGLLAIADLDEEGGLFHDNHAGVFHHGFDREALRGLLARAGFSSGTPAVAARVNKPGSDGIVRTFAVFLLIAKKHGNE